MDLWCPFAVRRDGPTEKVGYPGGIAGVPSDQWIRAPKRGEVKHSAEGYWDGAHINLDNLNLNSSWTFTVGYDRIEQHYAIDINTWHGNDTDNDGLVRANVDLVGVEHLGVAGEPLTPWQVDATARLTKWLAAQWSYSAFARYPQQVGVWTLAEHNQIGNTPTACPSNRIPWSDVLARLNEGDDDMWTRFNKVSAWYAQPEHQGLLSGAQTSPNAWLDFGLPTTAKSLDIEIEVQRPVAGAAVIYALDGAPELDVMNGYAGKQYVPERGYATLRCRVQVDDKGRFTLRSEGGVQLVTVGCTGYYT